MFSDYQTTTVATQAGTGGWLFWLLLVLFLLCLGGLAYFWIKRLRNLKKAAFDRSLNLAFLRIMVPREAGADNLSQEATKQNEQELISIAEQLFTTLYFEPKKGWSAFWHGQEFISFEIVAVDKKIYFYIVCPRHMVSGVEKQVHSQYPKASIEETESYQIFQKSGLVSATELVLQKKHIYPIKTYREQSTDPLNALTNALSKLSDDEAIVIQYVLSPAHRNWGNHLRKLAEDIQKGKHPKEIDRSAWQKFGSDMTGAFKSKKEEVLDKPHVLTPMHQELVKKLEEKGSKTGYQANIRVLSVSDHKTSADNHLGAVLSAFSQYSLSPFNNFKAKKKHVAKIVHDYLLRAYNPQGIILNTEELASLWHPPTKFTETPNIAWMLAKKSPAPNNLAHEGILLGINEYRGTKTEVRIHEDDRRRHMYIVGRTGVGKTEIMKAMSAQDIKDGKGVCIIDPHGDFVEDILAAIPKERADDVVLFDPSDMERPFGMNMLDVTHEAQKDFAVQEMIAIFYKLFPPEYLGPMFEHYMRNVMLTLIADISDPGTLVEIPRMFTDKAFQAKYIARVKDPNVRAFWEQEMSQTDFSKGGGEMLGYLISKLGRFIENELMRNIIGQQRSSFDFRQIMDENKILLVNLSKGKIGEINAKLLGLIVVSKLQMAAMSRADVPESERHDFYLYVDEFQNFVTDSFAIILSEARKYRLNLIVAHQYLAQLAAAKPGSSAADSTVRDAVFGNVGSMIAFRIGVEDAEIIAKEMAPVFNEFDVVNVEKFNCYAKIMIHGTASRPFSMKTLPLQKHNDAEAISALKELSRLKNGRMRSQVEQIILERTRVDQILGQIPTQKDGFA